MTEITQGTLTFVLPDPAVGPEKLAFFAFPPAKEFILETVELHDYRKDCSLVKGPSGLDAQGFTVVNHESTLSGSQCFSETAAEDYYLPEVISLVKELTGASKVAIANASFRRRLTSAARYDPTQYKKATDPLTFDMKILTSSAPKVNGKDVEKSPEPARSIHCDFTLKGLQRNIRHVRPDVTAMAAPVLEAEDFALKTNSPYLGPRYAAYSIWRPLKVVRRDPLIVADWSSIDTADFVPFEHRIPTAEGEFRSEAYMIRPGDVSRQKWYWLPEQRPDEALVIKLADSEERGGKVAGSTPHGSPIISGCEDEEPRESIEVRVFAFW